MWPVRKPSASILERATSQQKLQNIKGAAGSMCSTCPYEQQYVDTVGTVLVHTFTEQTVFISEIFKAVPRKQLLL